MEHIRHRIVDSRLLKNRRRMPPPLNLLLTSAENILESSTNRDPDWTMTPDPAKRRKSLDTTNPLSNEKMISPKTITSSANQSPSMLIIAKSFIKQVQHLSPLKWILNSIPLFHIYRGFYTFSPLILVSSHLVD